jgi:hypothetical protein
MARSHGASSRTSAVALLATLALTPLPFLVAMGLEHVLHLALVLWLAVDVVRDGPLPRRAYPVMAVLPLVRPESLFLLLAAFGIRASFRRLDCVVLGAVGVVPWALSGLVNKTLGGLFLPNSVIMKSAMTGDLPFLQHAWNNLAEGSAVAALVSAVGMGGLVSRREGPSAHSGAPADLLARSSVLFIATALQQVALGGVGWVYRYEAWLVGWGLVLAIVALGRLAIGRAALVVVGSAVLVSPVVRSAVAWRDFVPQALATHLGNRQIAELVGRAWPDSVLAVHDIGIIRTLTDARIVDVAGIATTEVTRLHLAHQLNTAEFGRIVREGGADIAVTDVHWMENELPEAWVRVGSLQFPLTGGRSATYAFWATSPESVAKVRAGLERECPLVDSRSTCSVTTP